MDEHGVFSGSRSPTDLLPQLQALLQDKEKQLQMAGTLGQRILAQQMELEERVNQLSNIAVKHGDSDSSDQETKDKLRRLAETLQTWDHENSALLSSLGLDKHHLGADSGSLSFEVPDRTEAARHMTTAAQSSRRAKNAAHRADDVEFAFEIGSGLLTEVRRLQSLLGERDKAIQDMKEEKDDLERSVEALRSNLQTQEQNADKFKEENWNLEVALQELRQQNTETTASAQRLEGEQRKLANQLAAAREAVEKYKSEAEHVSSMLEEHKAHHETDVAHLRKTAAGLQRDKSDLQIVIDNLRTESEKRLRIPRRAEAAVTGKDLGGSSELLQLGDDEGIAGPEHQGINDPRHDELEDSLLDSIEHANTSSPVRLASPTQQEYEALKRNYTHAQRQIATLKNSLQKEKELRLQQKKVATMPVSPGILSPSKSSEEGENPVTQPKSSRIHKVGYRKSPKLSDRSKPSSHKRLHNESHTETQEIAEEIEDESDEGTDKDYEKPPLTSRLDTEFARASDLDAEREQFVATSVASPLATELSAATTSEVPVRVFKEIAVQISQMDQSLPRTSVAVQVSPMPRPLQNVEVQTDMKASELVDSSSIASRVGASFLEDDKTETDGDWADARESFDVPIPVSSDLGPFPPAKNSESASKPASLHDRGRFDDDLALTRIFKDGWSQTISSEQPSRSKEKTIPFKFITSSHQAEPYKEEAPVRRDLDKPQISRSPSAPLVAISVEPSAPLDRTRPPTVSLPPPPMKPPPPKLDAAAQASKSMPPPADIPIKRSSVPPRPISPPPRELLQRATTPISNRMHDRDRSARNSIRSSRNTMVTPQDSGTFEALRNDHRHASMISLLSDAQSSTASRRTSVSSDRFHSVNADPRHYHQADDLPSGHGTTDPNVIHSITQAMIGEFLFKYTRRAIGKGHGDRRHKRYFWVHPYTRTLYWSSSDPGASGVAESNAKSAFIESVRSVLDPNPMPPGLYQYSVVVSTPQREMKITAPTKERHDIWLNALRFLLSRPASGVAIASPAGGRATIGARASTGMLVDDQGARGLSSPRSHRTIGTVYGEESWNITPRAAHQLSPAGSLRKRQGTPAAEYLRWRADAPGSPTPSLGPQGFEHIGPLGEDVDFEIHDDTGTADAFEGLENVRTCCNGAHIIGQHHSDDRLHHVPDELQHRGKYDTTRTRDSRRPVSPSGWSFRSRTGSSQSHDPNFLQWNRGQDTSRSRFGSRRSVRPT